MLAPESPGSSQDNLPLASLKSGSQTSSAKPSGKRKNEQDGESLEDEINEAQRKEAEELNREFMKALKQKKKS